MRTLEDICNSPAIMMHRRFDLTKEMLDAPGPLRFHPRNDWTEEGAECIRKEHQEQAGFYFCIHAWNNKPRLALVHFMPDGEKKTEDITGFPEKFLVEAIQQSSESIRHANARIHVGGHFLITKPIEDMIRAGLVIAGKKKEESK